MKNIKYKGEIEGFPTEVVEWMMDNQVKQGNKRDVSVFEKSKCLSAKEGGFDWQLKDDKSNDFFFMVNVIGHTDFDLFFSKYPKVKKPKPKIYAAETPLITPEQIIFLGKLRGEINEQFESVAKDIETVNEFAIVINNDLVMHKQAAGKQITLYQYNSLKKEVEALKSEADKLFWWVWGLSLIVVVSVVVIFRII